MKLLVVEAAPRLRDTLQRSLSRLGHAVDATVDGRDGIWLAT